LAGAPLRELTALPRPLAYLRGPTYKGEWRGWEEKGRKGRERERAAPPCHEIMDPPLLMHCFKASLE